MSAKKTLLAVKGEVFTCRNGHPTYAAARDLYLGEFQLTARDFVPVEGQCPAIILCAHCYEPALHSLDVRATEFSGPHGYALSKALEARMKQHD